MLTITRENLEEFLLGSAFLGTGGGENIADKERVFRALLRRKKEIEAISVSKFPKGQYLASVYGVGDPSVDVSMLIKKAITMYRKTTGIDIRGIVPGEIGAEALAFQAGLYANLPVVDSDLVGGRAAPEIQMDVFSVYGIPIVPVIGVSLTGKNMLLTGNFTAEQVEVTLREFFDKNGGAGALVGYPIRAGTYQKIGIQKTLSRTLVIGTYLARQDLKNLLRYCKGKVIGEGKILGANLKREKGFRKGVIKLSSFSVLVKNENIAVLKNGRKIVSAPDGIVLLDEKCVPIHNSLIKKYIGKNVKIVSFAALGYWKLRRAKKLWKSSFDKTM